MKRHKYPGNRGVSGPDRAPSAVDAKNGFMGNSSAESQEMPGYESGFKSSGDGCVSGPEGFGQSSGTGSFRVCILDGDHGAGRDLERIVSSMGCEVLCLDRVIGASNRIRSFDPDLLVVDVQMPGLSGPGLLEVLQKNLGTLPVMILHSCLEEDELMELATNAGADDFVPKNGNYVSLLSKIKYYSRIVEET
ncbi:MAG: response regulator [bacterium]